MFQLLTETECELTTFVGRTQKSGPEDVPAVSFRLLFKSARNELLDLFSPTIRQTAYAPVEGQDQLPGVEPSTPILRSKDLKHWAPETRLEGWSVSLARGRSEATALQMGSCKIDDFKFDFHDGGYVDFDCRVSTADVDEEGAGMLWGRQKRKVFVRIVAPELPATGTTEATGAEIDGTKGHPGAAAAGQGSLLDTDASSEPRDDGLGTFADDMGGDTSLGDDGAAEQAELEAGMRESIAAAGVRPKRGRARAAA